MRRLGLLAAMTLLAVACGSEPMLATDRDSTTTTPPTTTVETTTTIMEVATTTTVESGPDVSDILRIAHDELYEFDSLRFVANTDSADDLTGEARATIVGRWNRDGTSEMQLAFDIDEQAVDILSLSIDEDPDTVAATLEGLSILYRFPDDGHAWFSPSTIPEWTGVPMASFGNGATDVAADALTYLDPFFQSIIEIDPEPIGSANPAHTVYRLVLDADLIVPIMASASSSQALFDAGYDGVSGATTTGTVTLDDNGSFVAASVDQTPWWVAGWEIAGVSAILGDATVQWSIGVTTGQEQQSVVAPCDDPTTTFDAELGVDTLVCP